MTPEPIRPWLVAVAQKARNLERELQKIPDPFLRASALREFSKCFQFLAEAIGDDWRTAQEIASLERLV